MNEPVDSNERPTKWQDVRRALSAEQEARIKSKLECHIQKQGRMPYSDVVRKRAYLIDPEAWISYSGMSPEHKREVEKRRSASLEIANSQIEKPYTKATMERAKNIAKRHQAALLAIQDWDVIRDLVDDLTGGELDCTQLDLMTDWVMAEAFA